MTNQNYYYNIFLIYNNNAIMNNLLQKVHTNRRTDLKNLSFICFVLCDHDQVQKTNRISQI